MTRNPKCTLQLSLHCFFVPFCSVVPSWAQPQSPKPAYLQGMQAVIAGGTTPETVTPPKIDGLKQLGTRRLRLINVDVKTLQGSRRRWNSDRAMACHADLPSQVVPSKSLDSSHHHRACRAASAWLRSGRPAGSTVQRHGLRTTSISIHS